MKTSEIMGRLRAVCLPKMESYQTDLAHDQRWIEEHPGAHFMHICTTTSTHIMQCPQGYGADEREPFLFGHATPSEINQQYLGCIRSAQKGHLWRGGLWHYFDGRRLVMVSDVAAERIFNDYVKRSERLLRRAG